MATIVDYLTISGFKSFSSDCENSETVNVNITNGNIYSYQDSALLGGSVAQKTIYLVNNATATAKAGVRTVDTLSVMVRPTTTTDIVYINGYTATSGVGNGAGAISNWKVYAPQAASSSVGVANSPAYTVSTPATPAGPQTLTAISLSTTYNSNYALEVVEGSNMINIQVWNSAGTTKKASYTYYVTIVSSNTRLVDLVATLNPAGGSSYKPEFDSNYCQYDNQVYTLMVAPSATSMTLTPYTPPINPLSPTGINSIITITPPSGTPLAPITSGTASSSFAIQDNDSLTVLVTSPDGITSQSYVLTIQSDVAGNNLSAATFSYYSSPSTLSAFDTTATSWSPLVPNASNLLTNNEFSYLNTIPNISYGLSVFLSAVDSGASVSIGGVVKPISGTFLIPYSSLNQGQNIITCECISSTGSVKTYTFNIWLAGSDTAPLSSGILSNISFNPTVAVFDGDNLFTSSNYSVCASLADIVTKYGTSTIPVYNIYVAASTSNTSVTVSLTYNDNGSRFSTKLGTAAWDPTSIEATPPAATNTGTDNWTRGSLRTVTVTVPVNTLAPSNTNYLLIASHLPGSAAYYGYALQFVTPKANLSSINLSSSTTGASINLNPSFNSILQSYSAYIGTASAPTRFVNLSVLFPSAGINNVDYLVSNGTNNAGTAYVAANALTSGASPVTVTLAASVASSYILWIRLWSPTSATLVGYYTLNLLNVDQSLLLSGLVVADQAPADTQTGIYPAPTPVNLTPTFSATTFVYNAPVTTQYCSIKPTVSSPSSKSITISLNGSTPVAVTSGNYYLFPMNVIQIAVVITVYDNLTPTNSNSYTVFVYSNSSNLQLSLANFLNISNSNFSTPLPDGVTITSPITAAANNITCTNATVSTTQFKGRPVQAGTSMFLNTFTGFEVLSPDSYSNNITLTPGAVKTIPIWLFATNRTSANYFNFQITQISDTNSYLSSMVLSNCSNFNFVSTTQTYNNITLNSPFTEFSFIPTTQSVNSSMTYTLNGSSPITVVSGNSVTVSATNFGSTPNTLLITVTPQSGIPRVYSFYISRVANAYLSNIRVYTSSTLAIASTLTSTTGTVDIVPSPFNPLFNSIASQVGPSFDTAYIVLNHAPESSITMSGGSRLSQNGGVNSAGNEIWAVPVQVSTSPQNTLAYSINPAIINVLAGTQSFSYNLSIVRQYPTAIASDIFLKNLITGLKVQLNTQQGAMTSFNSTTFAYTISATNGNTFELNVVGVGDNSYFYNGVEYFIPINVTINQTTPIVVQVRSNSDLSTSLYQISLLN
jgi:hypothetical protein